MKSPPFLIGAALVFWGLETGLFIPGAALALAAESPRWLGWRWEFDDSSVGRVFTLCLLLAAGITVYRLATGWFNHPTWFLVKWLPVAVLPLHLIQGFSATNRVNVWALSPLVRKASGVSKDTVLPVDLSFFCFAAILLASAAANQRGAFFYPTAVFLLAYAFFPMRGRRHPAWVWAGLVFLGTAAGFGVFSGLSSLQAVLEQHTLRLLAAADDPFMAFTRLGHVETLKPSSRILFWVRSNTPGYHYLQEAVYDTYASRRTTVWKNLGPHLLPGGL